MKKYFRHLNHNTLVTLIESFFILCGGLFIFVFLSLFFPFPYLPKIYKVILIITFILMYLIIIILIKEKFSKWFINEISWLIQGQKLYWGFHLLFASIMTFLLSTLVIYHPPIIPIKYQFGITSTKLSIPSIIYTSWPCFYNIARVILLFALSIFSSIYIKSKFPDKKDQLVLFPLTFFLFYFFISSINYQNELVNIFSHNFFILSSSLLIFIFVPILVNYTLRKNPRLEFMIFISILLIIGALQLFYIMNIPNMQVGDFSDFNSLATKLAEDDAGISIGMYGTFIRLLSLFYRIYPSALTAKLINIFLTSISMTGLYLIGKKIGHSNTGIISAYIFGMLPSQSGMVVIVNNDIPSITLLIFFALCLIHYFQDSKWYWLFISAFLFGIAFRIRSTLLIYSPVLILPYFSNFKYSVKEFINRTKLIALGFLTSIFMISAFITLVFGIDVVFKENRNILYTLLNGTNINYGGRHNFPDQELIRSLPQERLFQEGLPIVYNRIFSDPINYYKFLKVKYSYLFGDATYTAGHVLNFEKTDQQIFETKWGFSEEKIYQVFAKYSQYSYFSVLGASIFFIFFYKQAFRKISWVGLINFLCALFAYAVFEVQPRYNRPIIPFIVFFAASVYSDIRIKIK